MGRPAQPEEIAPAYVFLAAPTCSSYITGEILPMHEQGFCGYTHRPQDLVEEVRAAGLHLDDVVGLEGLGFALRERLADPATRAVVQTLDVGSTPTGVAVGGGDVWVTDTDSSRVFRVDPGVDRVVQSIAVGNAPTGVAVGDGSVWVAKSSDGTLTRIDAGTGDIVKTIALSASVSDVAVGAGAVGVSDEAGDRVFRVDPRSDQVTGSVGVGTGPTAIAATLRGLRSRAIP